LVLPDPGQGKTLVVVPVYWDYQGRVDVKLGDDGRLTAMAFGSDDTLHVLRANAEMAATFNLNSHIGFHRFRVGYTRPLPDKLTFSVAEVIGLDVVSLDAGDRTSTELHNTSAGTRVRVSGEIAPTISLDTGIDLDYRNTSYRLVIPNNQDFRQAGSVVDIPPELVDRSVDTYGLAGYLELGIRILPNVRVIPALRVDTYLIDGQSRVSPAPRLVGRWDVSGETTLKAFGGIFHEPPSPETLDAMFGNPDLSLQRAIHSGVGVEQKFGRHISLDAELYYNWRT